MDSSFGEAMKSLNQFSSIPLAIGRNLMPVTAALTKFGKESLETYASFDDAMRTVEGKLGDVGARQMDALRTQAREWASTTRYHATDVAAALAEAAGSGWSLEEMYQGMPSVLAMAAGGNMDLSAALGYLSTALAGMNLGFDESAQVVDEWMKTASSSRATATDIGESLQMLGSIATFADSKEEMFTLLAMMAEFGTTGSEAGTLLRNVMMRVVAPTKSAAEAMAALGVTEEELSESLTEDGYDMGQAAQAMQSLGFSAYDTEGNLKPVTQIVSELRDATADMTEQQRFDVLSKIFPQRSIRGILDLMRATDEQYAQMMAEISGSAGYAQYMADLQEGGVGGSMRRLESQWEELQIAVGEQLAPIAMGAMETIGNVLTGISGMDKGNLNILTRSLMGLAGAAPAMMAVGGAMRMISMLGTPGGQLTAAVVLASLAAGAIGGLIDNMEQLDRQRFEANFGTATIDTSMLSAALQQIQSEYAAASAEVAGYVSAVQQAAADYGTATSSLTGGLWTAVATGLKLTNAQKLELEGYGDRMYQSLMEGARKSVDADLAFLELLSGGETPEELLGEAGPAGTMGSLLLSAYDGLTAAVQEKSDALKAAMKSAFSDDIITQEEYQNIMNAVSEMQEMSQLIFESQASAEYDNVIRKADQIGVEGVEQFVTQTAQVRDTQLAALENDLDRQYTSIMEKFRFAQAQGLEFMDPTTGQMVNASTLDEGWVSGFNRWYNEQAQGRRQGIMNDFNEAVLRGAESAALNSDFGGDWGQLMQMVGGEGFTSVGAMMAFGNAGEGTGSLQHMVTYAQEMVDAMGGAQAVMEAAAAMEASGNTEGAATMRGYASIAGIDTSFETQNEAQALYEAQQEKQRQQAEIDAAEELSSSEGGSVFDAVADAVSETSAALAKMLPTRTRRGKHARATGAARAQRDSGPRKMGGGAGSGRDGRGAGDHGRDGGRRTGPRPDPAGNDRGGADSFRRRGGSRGRRRACRRVGRGVGKHGAGGSHTDGPRADAAERAGNARGDGRGIPGDGAAERRGRNRRRRNRRADGAAGAAGGRQPAGGGAGGGAGGAGARPGDGAGGAGRAGYVGV